MEQEYASTLLETAVNELSRLPGIGRKTALRLALHILRQDLPYMLQPLTRRIDGVRGRERKGCHEL